MQLFLRFIFTLLTVLVIVEKVKLISLGLELGDKCDVFGSNLPGTCQADSKCSHFLRLPRKDLKKYGAENKCAFVKKTQVICCPLEPILTSRTPLRECADSKKRPDKPLFAGNHIMDGEDAEVGEFPHNVALGYKNENVSVDTINWNCGGTLISNKFVLTAAHCCLKHQKPSVVRMGKTSLDLYETEDPFEEMDVDIKSITIHPDYKRRFKYNDIAIIELDEPVDFSYNVWPACLPQKKMDDTAQTQLHIAGFGLSEDESTGGTMSSWMQKATVQEISAEECRGNYSSIYKNLSVIKIPQGIIDSQICARNRTSKANTCKGDSGSGIHVKEGNSFFVVGITSFGVSCASSLPSVYTNVFNYIEWIESIIWPSHDYE